MFLKRLLPSGRARLLVGLVFLLSVLGPLPVLAATRTPAPLALATPTSAGGTPTPTGSAATLPPVTSSGPVLLPRGSTWQYSFDQTNWSSGLSPFANPNGCNEGGVGTSWLLTDPDTMYLKKTLTLSGPVTGAVAYALIDDEIILTINGQQIADFDSQTCGNYFNQDLAIPDGVLHAGDNLIEVTAINFPTRTPNAKSFDLEITGNGGGPANETVVSSLQPKGQPYRGSNGDPVDTASGMYSYRKVDLAIPGRGPSPTFVRDYNSADTVMGPLGRGWIHSYQSRIVVDGNGNTVVVNPEGRRDVYAPLGGGNFTPPVGVADVLTQDTNTGYYTLVHPDQSAWIYDGNGHLTSIKDRYGNQSTLTYNANNELATVSDPAGRGSLTLAYDTCYNGRLCSVTDWQSPARSVQFTYDSAGRLWKVTDRNGQVTTYGYDGTSSNLTTITDANNHVAITNTYDSQGRVIAQKDALGITTSQQTTFSYVTNPDGSETTTVTKPATSFDSNWQPQEVDSYDPQGRRTQRISKPTSTETDTSTATYDSNYFTTSTTDARTNTTSYCYDVDYTGATISGNRGNLTRVISPPPINGQNPLVTLSKYDSKNNLIETIPPKGVNNGAIVSCTTDLSASLNLTYATDNTYDANGIDLLSKTSKYTDPDLGAQTAITKFEYNDASNPGLVTKIVPPRGNTGGTPDYSYATSFAYYNATGNPTEAGMLQSTTDPLGNKTTYTYDAVGRRLTMVDPNGNAAGGTPSAHTWTYAYDNEDRLTSASVPAPTTGGTALTTTYTYDPVGNRTVVKGANSQVTKYLYDVRDSLSEVDQSPSAWTDPNVAPSPKYVTTYSYDNLGNLSRVTRAQGDANNERATDYAYDGLNRLRKETQYPSWPATTPTLVTSYTYDANGNRLTTVDPLNQTTTDGYDAENRLTSISYSDGTTPNVAFVFDANGNRTSMADGTGSTSYAYDETDRLLSVTSPGPKTVGYRYDLDGNRTKMIYPDSTAVTYTFDKASQLQSLFDWASRQVSYQYNPDGSLKLATNFNGTTASYSYDNALRLLQILNQKGTATISQQTYTLDNVGNRTQVSDNLPSATPPATHTWDYDTSAQGWTGTAGSNSTLSFVSNDGSPSAGSIQAEITRKGKSDTNLWSIDQTWEQLGVPAGATVTSVRLSTIRERTSTWTSPGATNTWKVELRNTAGATQATLLGTQTESGLEASWSSDLSGTDQPVPSALQASNSTVRLAIIASQSLANQNGADVAFRWDHVSLVITYISRNTYGYDHLYRLTNVNNGATTYSYDPAGNRLSKGSTSYTYDRADRILIAGSTSYTVNPNGNATARGSDSFTYDQANRLTSATVSGTTSTYTYDGDGNRASKTVGGTTTNYVYDVNASLPNVLTDGTLKYVYGLGLAYTVDGSGNVQVYHTDGLGSVRAITDSSGNVIATYTTDEFGIPTQTQGTSSQPFQYTGQQRDPESGLYYLRARMYDPSIGRFLSRDPLFGNVSSPQSLNRYAYASENPVTLVDPSGTELCNEESGQSSECGGEIVGGAPPPVGPGETPPAVSKQAQDSYPSKRSVEPYEVGIYTPMKNRSRGDNLDIHHAPQGALAERLQPGYNYRQGPSIALPPEEHDDITVAQSQEAAARSQLSLQQLIEADIAHIQQYTNAPPEAVSALRKLISDVLK